MHVISGKNPIVFYFSIQDPWINNKSVVTVTIIKLVARFLKLSLYCTFSFFIVKGTIRLNRGEDEIMGKGATPFLCTTAINAIYIRFWILCLRIQKIWGAYLILNVKITSLLVSLIKSCLIQYVTLLYIFNSKDSCPMWLERQIKKTQNSMSIIWWWKSPLTPSLPHPPQK